MSLSLFFHVYLFHPFHVTESPKTSSSDIINPYAPSACNDVCTDCPGCVKEVRCPCLDGWKPSSPVHTVLYGAAVLATNVLYTHRADDGPIYLDLLSLVLMCELFNVDITR